MASARPGGGRRLRSRPRWTRRRILAGALVLAVLAGVVAWFARPSPPSYSTHSQALTVRTGPGGAVPMTLDTTYYEPNGASAAHPATAVLLAHGFGGTKDSVADDAHDLAGRGYAVLTWSAEGFGRSGGQIHLDSPDWEVRDARGLIDWLAARPEVRKDRPGDPRVAAMGGSYGGALALLLAGYDQRVDAVVAQITWNDLANAFLPESTGAGPGQGVFKKAWAGLLFGEGGVPPGAVPAGAASAANAQSTGAVSCGRFAADICQTYLSVATTGRAGLDQVALLRRSSPASVLGQIRAPTLLLQGEADSLFPLSEADANARGIAATGTPVRVAWYTGGHDGGDGPQNDQDRLHLLTGQWLAHHLAGQGDAPGDSFTYSRISGIDAGTGGVVAQGFSAGRYPGLTGQSATSVRLSGGPQVAASPPNGTPAAVSLVPGTTSRGLTGTADDPGREVPSQHADFTSAPLPSTVDVVGAPSVQLRAASPTGEATVFVKLYDLDPRQGPTLPDGLVAPVHLTGLPASIDAGRPVTVTLPAIAHEFQAGHRMRVTVATSDGAYATPPSPTVYTLAAGGQISLPTVAGRPIAAPTGVWWWVLAGLAAVVAAGVGVAIWLGRRRHRRPPGSAQAAYADRPLVVEGLRKEYPDGFVGVARLDFAVDCEQVVGMLGPNGAGKTTALRVLMGLIQPTAGDVYVFGQRLTPGAPVLSRLGALVEGPGFLPHLSGLANLQLYWRSTGRPEADAAIPDVLEIAGLGDDINRRVRSYSHGMKQRLAIAQAMLGLPDLLVLDEPTDGLDPPQIAEMRRVLKRYATDGRAVLVSSHLLAEVEQTCTHVVVVHRGEVVAAGPVDDIVGESAWVQFDVSDPEQAARVLEQAGVADVTREGRRTLVADLNGTPRATVVAALVEAGVAVERVVPRRRLEDAFLALIGGERRTGSGE
jgi:ABC-2 type transport system ATP-binding protein